jgi:uncharacterized protein (TIGR03435 family)
MCRFIAPIVLIGILIAPSGQAQMQAGPKPSFDVVSIKEATDCGNVAPGVKLKIPGGTTYGPGGRYTTCNQLRYIIGDAYQTELFSLAEVPDWSIDILYRIEAKADGNPDKEQMRLMVQSLLEERFKLKMHGETRETPVYSLVVAKGGHKLQPAKDEQGNPIVSLPPPEERKKKGMENMAAGSSRSLSEIISSMAPGSYMVMGGRQAVQFTGKAISMESFATALYSIAGRRKVIDKTGLTGLYDIQMNYAPPGPPGAADPALSTEPSAPTIFNALQEQLGLKLESEKAPLDYFIIDSMEKPSEN